MARGLEKAAALLGFAAGTVFFLKEMGLLKFSTEKTEDGKRTFTVEFDSEKAKKELSKAAKEASQDEDFYDDLSPDDEDEISRDIAESLKDLDPDGDGKF